MLVSAASSREQAASVGRSVESFGQRDADPHRRPSHSGGQLIRTVLGGFETDQPVSQASLPEYQGCRGRAEQAGVPRGGTEALIYPAAQGNQDEHGPLQQYQRWIHVDPVLQSR